MSACQGEVCLHIERDASTQCDIEQRNGTYVVRGDIPLAFMLAANQAIKEWHEDHMPVVRPAHRRQADAGPAHRKTRDGVLARLLRRANPRSPNRPRNTRTSMSHSALSATLELPVILPRSNAC